MDHTGNADPDLGHAEPGVMRGDADIAGGRDLEPGAETPAGQPRDDRGREVADCLAEIAQARDKDFG